MNFKFQKQLRDSKGRFISKKDYFTNLDQMNNKEDILSQISKEINLPIKVTFPVFDERDQQYKMMSLPKSLYDKITQGKKHSLIKIKEDFS